MREPNRQDHLRMMGLALEQARRASAQGEVPVGAVAVSGDGQIVGRAHNRRELDQDPLAHAELLTLQQAARSLGSWRLVGVTLYVTLEPCTMCAGALVNSRVRRLVYGCDDPKAGAIRSLYAVCEDPRLNHRVEVVRGVEAEACAALLRDFFTSRRLDSVES